MGRTNSGGWGGGSLEIGLPKGGGITHLKILLKGGGIQITHTVQLNLQHLFLTLVNMILHIQNFDCIATKITKVMISVIDFNVIILPGTRN